MRSAIAATLAAAVLIGAVLRSVRADVDAEQVRDAIARSVKFLKSKQTAAGQWNELAGLEGGVTALVTLALLSAGESPEEPHVARALAYLSRLRPKKTYVVALQTMAFAAADPKLYHHKIAGNARWLIQQQISTGDSRGGWCYPLLHPRGDPSNTQFALLALHEAERAGVEIPEKTWKDAVRYWLDDSIHSTGGAWRYRQSLADTGSMTCAGIASMVIAAGELYPLDAAVVGDRVIPCQRQAEGRETVAINKGLEWLSRNFTVWKNPGSKYRHFYYLYGLERVGRLTARRKIGGHDWYREGADMLLRDRTRGRFEGSWTRPGPAEQEPVIATSFALLFLAKGRRPVVMAKLVHGPGEDWNHHRSDVANLTHYVERRWKRNLTWQVLDTRDSEVDDLLTAPILLISGRDGLELADRMDLRGYVDAGGFIFAERAGGGEAFDRQFRALMAELFPDTPLRKLPADHPLYYAEEEVHPDHRPVLLGIDACCRTSVVYAPEDVTCYWEVAGSRQFDKYSPAVRAAVQGKLSLGINIVAYATGRELKDKLDTPHVAATETDETFERGKIYVVKLDHGGGSDAAPNALANLVDAARENLKLRIATRRRLVSLTDKGLFRYHIAFLHGRHGFRFSPEERENLRRFVERGGFVLADSICASREFTESLRREMAAIFPDRPLERIPTNHLLITGKRSGTDISTVSRREPEFHEAGGPLRTRVRKVAPELEGIKLGDRYGVVFSPYDISCALENRESLECSGYIRQDAAKIGLAAIQYALNQ